METIKSYAAEGCIAGTIVGLVENLWCVYTGFNVPLHVLGLNLLVLSVGGAIVSALIAVVTTKLPGKPMSTPPVPVIASAIGYFWLLTKAAEAARFRQMPVVLGILVLTSLLLLSCTSWAIGARSFHAMGRRLSPLLTGACLANFLVAGRYYAKSHFGGYFTSESILLHAALLATSITVVGLQVQFFSSGRRRSPLFRKLIIVLNGSALLTALFWWLARPASDEDFTPRPPATNLVETNVLIITIDTLRADRVSAYGYSRRTTPEIDDFSRDAMVFRNAISPSSWTLPSHASMFTGLNPSHHGAYFVEASTTAVPWIPAAPLVDERVTLAEVLRNAGYRTSAIVANAAYLHASIGIAQGFETYDDRPGRYFGYEPLLFEWLKPSPFLLDGLRKSYRPAVEITRAAIQRLREISYKPFFLFVNYMDPHRPYHPPSPYDGLFAGRRYFVGDPEADIMLERRSILPVEKAHYDAVYDGEVAYADRAVGDLLRELKAIGLYESTLIVITSDHGEYLGEHDLWGHGVGPHEEVHRIPLLVKLPYSELKGPYDNWVQTTDIFSTVLDTLSIPVPSNVDGEALPHVTHPVIIEQRPNPMFVQRFGQRFERGYRGLYEYPWKYVEFADGTATLSDLRELEEEIGDVSSLAEEMALLSEKIDAIFVDAPPISPNQERVDEEALRLLKSLGYIH